MGELCFVNCKKTGVNGYNLSANNNILPGVYWRYKALLVCICLTTG